jgi:hypothetical protein
MAASVTGLNQNGVNNKTSLRTNWLLAKAKLPLEENGEAFGDIWADRPSLQRKMA